MSYLNALDFQRTDYYEKRYFAISAWWDAINYETQTLSVLGTVTNKGSGTPAEYEVFRTAGKTDTSIRAFPMSDDQMQYFRALQN